MINGNFNWSEDFFKVFEHWTVWTAIASAIIVGGIKMWKRVKKTIRETDDNFIQIHSQIHEMLTELRVLTDAARTQVIQFHNGEYFMDGISMRKFSITHESVEKGIEADGAKVQGYLCSMFLPLLLQLIEDNGVKIRYTSDLRESYVKQYLESRNVEAYSVSPIKIHNMITGFIFNQWCNSNKIDQLNIQECSEQIAKTTNIITAQLGLQKR